MTQFDPGERPSIASITDKVRALPVGMPVSSIYFLGDTAVFVGVALCGEASAQVLGTIAGSVNPLVPKPGTAYQWLPMERTDVIERRPVLGSVFPLPL